MLHLPLMAKLHFNRGSCLKIAQMNSFCRKSAQDAVAALHFMVGDKHEENDDDPVGSGGAAGFVDCCRGR
jgi:hypothetical protein